MKKHTLFALWGGLFSLCAGLGFIPEPEGALRTAMTVLAVVSFLPPAVLLYRAGKRQESATLRLIRNFSALSLILTAVLLILNFLTVLQSETLGTVLYYVLVIVSSPMVCSGQWALSLFLWACLLMVSLRQLRSLRRRGSGA